MNHFVKTLKLLNNAQGETLVEVLVSILVSGLAILLMATAIAAATNTVMKTRTAFGTYYENTESIAKLASANDNATVTLETVGGNAVAISDQSDKDGVKVKYSVTTDGKPVVVYTESAS